MLTAILLSILLASCVIEPHQLATGVDHVFVNGVQALDEGEHTGATPGRVVRRPGYTGDGQ